MAIEPFQPKHQPTTFVRSLGYAWNGLVHTVLHQRNMRMHIIAALLVGQVGSGLKLGLAEKVTLIFCVLLVVFAEMLNSALEQLVDLAIQQFDERAKLTKDIAAAGVLVLAIGTVVIFAAIVVHNADLVLASGAAIERQVLLGAPLTILAGALMHERKRHRALTMAMALAAFGLWLSAVRFTESYVFWAMSGGLLALCTAAAWRRNTDR